MFYRGKHTQKSERTLKVTKPTMLLVSLVLIVALAVGSTMAYLIDTTDPVENTFTPVSVVTDIEEEVNGNIKSQVKFQNTGDIDAYIRATVAVYWMKDGQIVPMPEGGAITGMETIGSNWFQVGQIYYYKSAVAPTAYTDVLFAEIVATVPTGYEVKVDVHVEGIQAEPTAAVEEAWLDVDVDATTKLLVAAN